MPQRSMVTAALLTVASALALGCQTNASTGSAGGETTPAKAENPKAEGKAASREGFKTYGAKLQAADVTPLQEVLKAPDAFQGKTVTVDGRVRRACNRKGCWMELAEGMSPSRPGCRVTFKDYGFFVPLDAAGAQARVQGNVTLRKVPAARVEHLEQEGAQFPKKEADGSAYEVSLVATGVELDK